MPNTTIVADRFLPMNRIAVKATPVTSMPVTVRMTGPSITDRLSSSSVS
ncbi:hypothetical protein DFR74_102508 [Nocardia puris]|uniref:Uncharacterized protein n=1 Tax=Nocardia puris TaxID=208602 RepID=A0A366DY20_9NOCA|nr:hypothetical protein DFR74_102508 [Nocardia puris]